MLYISHIGNYYSKLAMCMCLCLPIPGILIISNCCFYRPTANSTRDKSYWFSIIIISITVVYTVEVVILIKLYSFHIVIELAYSTLYNSIVVYTMCHRLSWGFWDNTWPYPFMFEGTKFTFSHFSWVVKSHTHISFLSKVIMCQLAYRGVSNSHNNNYVDL